MGIPMFYSWLLQKYPEIKMPYNETNHRNKIVCDNLYIDTNQIIYKNAQLNDENEIINSVFHYIDRIVSIIRPRQLLYMAIDGVVPRAKMMGQRANRFLKSKNIADGLKKKILTNDQHQAVPTETFDECNIKPGTKFMSKLSERLQNHICHMVNTEDTWHSLKIILSDANVPGEGEHKIINFIRQQRNQRDYVPNKYHFIYCSDSDLVLLGLLRHECNFTIICEECDTCKNIGHSAKDCDTIKNSQKNKSSLTTTDTMETKYVFIDASKLSNLLKDELEKKNSLTFPRKSECSIDDWVFICLLFGNDFLPKSPSINFFDKIITMNDLIDVYRKHVEETRGYLTTNGTINMNRLLTFLKKVGQKDQVGRFSSQQYYRVKFEAKKTPLEVVTNYVQGLCWVFQYYYQGPPSWNWYYPCYYAPLAYDFSNLTGVLLNFDQNTKPWHPLEQMMATFSPHNAKYLPLEWQRLMLYEKSPIIEFYPQHFQVDPNDHKKSSQYVALIPFIDEERLLQALEPIYSKLTPEEKKHNTLDDDRLFIHSQNPDYPKFKELSDNAEKHITENDPIQLQIRLTGRLLGYVWKYDKDNIINTDNNQVICFKNCDSLFRNESVEKDVHNSFSLQTASNQSNPDSTAQSQSQQQQVLSSKQVYKPAPWSKLPQSHHN